MAASRWPSRLWIVRHGESAGNVARDEAHAQGVDRIALTSRDVDIPLSIRGEEQACALGRWFARSDDDHRPDVILASPYLRAKATAELFREHGGASRSTAICLDERLREKEFGILDGLTTSGVASIYPDQAEFRRLLGKFYHRPPGGESWCDVIFRLRSVMDTIALHHAGRRVMIVAHQVVVLCLRYVIEGMDEAAILAIDRAGDVLNSSITEYESRTDVDGDRPLALVRYNAVPHLDEPAGTVATAEPEQTGAVRG